MAKFRQQNHAKQIPTKNTKNRQKYKNCQKTKPQKNQEETTDASKIFQNQRQQFFRNTNTPSQNDRVSLYNIKHNSYFQPTSHVLEFIRTNRFHKQGPILLMDSFTLMKISNPFNVSRKTQNINFTYATKTLQP